MIHRILIVETMIDKLNNAFIDSYCYLTNDVDNKQDMFC